ncbi:hypothetical protein QQZ08_004385 [Neonectria magnoliae]|uniref:Uncharacterized protein n=1 Tax=Neonectria magnoliae TaxID=2732573 RepID=A0ABR1I850_9HYPO
MQELLQLRPALDLVSMAEDKRNEALGTFSRLMEDYRRHKSSGGAEDDLDDKYGVYSNAGLKLYLDIRPTKHAGKAREFLLNGMPSQHHYLEHFGESTFGFPPQSHEEQESRCIIDYVLYNQLLLTFKKGNDGNFDRLEWVMQPGLDAIVFTRAGT